MLIRLNIVVCYIYQGVNNPDQKTTQATDKNNMFASLQWGPAVIAGALTTAFIPVPGPVSS